MCYSLWEIKREYQTWRRWLHQQIFPQSALYYGICRTWRCRLDNYLPICSSLYGRHHHVPYRIVYGVFQMKIHGKFSIL